MTDDVNIEKSEPNEPRTYLNAFDELISKIVCWNARRPYADLKSEAALEFKDLALQGIRDRICGKMGIENDITDYVEKRAKERAVEYFNTTGKKDGETFNDELCRVAAASPDRRSCVVTILNFLATPPAKVAPVRRR